MKPIQYLLQLLTFYIFSFKFFYKKLFVLLFLSVPIILSATTLSLTNSTSNSITDNTCFDRIFDASSLNNVTIDNITISVDITHTYRGDLELYLTSPSNIEVKLKNKENNNGTDNLNVLFTDAASTSISGDTSIHNSTVNRKPANTLTPFNGQNPQGTWKLRVCDRYDGDTGTFNTSTLKITYNAPPTANAGTDQTITVGSPVTLNGLGTDSDGTITNYLWTEGATTLSNAASFTKNDFSIGTHTLTFTVTDNDGATASDTVVITVLLNLPPVANAGTDQVINIGDNAILDGSGSSDSDGNITDYSWYEGGSVVGSGINITLSGLTAGTHSFTLTVTDDDGDTANDTVNVRVNAAPVANAGPDQNITLGDSITLDGSGSTDDFNTMTYAWNEANIPVNSTGVAPTINISTAGTYTITLTVTDDNGLTDTDTVVIHVNTPPVVEDMNFTILRNTPVSFELNATDADGDTIVSYPIFTSPSHGTLSGPESNMTYTPNLDYTGTDTFTYKAYDGMDNSNEGVVTITVYPPATAISDDFNTTYLTLLTGNVFANDLGLHIALIDFNTTSHGSLNISNDGSFTYMPDNEFDGNDTFSYTIKDDFNMTDTTTVNITVFPPRSDLSISKSAPTSVDGGDAMDYTLTITNIAGDQYLVANSVRVTDTLPNGVIYDGVTAPSGWTCGFSGATLSCDANNLSPGYSDDIVIHTFAPDIRGDITNTATVSSDIIDPDLTNNSSSATTNITGADVDMNITKTVSATTVTTTSSFTYTLNVQNQGTADTTNVTINDTLDPLLGFISIDGGTDWICSQGSTINCTYTANGGLFTAGNSANAIVINVRAPAEEANITNTASVKSDTAELNTSNNTDSVDISVISGTSQTGSAPLTKYLQYNIYGDMRLIGNANVNYSGTDPNQNYNDNVNMRYVDTDSITSTFNSSSSTLALADPSYNIIWVGLYWSGHVCSTDANGTSNGNGTGCDWSNSNFTNFNQATTNTNLGSIQLKTPKRANYINITANTLNIIQRTTTDWTYSAFADITNLIDRNETGTYTAADIVLSEGQVSNGGNYGGWAMLVVYEDNNNTLHYKNISVFNGFQRITSDDNPLQISGFLTPLSGDITASIAFFAGDGDPTPGGVARMREGNTNTYSAIGSVAGNAQSPATNLFNSTVGEFGQAINPGVLKTYGVDADKINVSSFMVNGQTDTEFRLDVATPTGGVDWYNISLFAFATDLTTPIIDGFEKSAVIIDDNGSRRVSDPNEPIYPGSSLEYTIRFTNTGDEIAEAVEIFDDFDYDGLTRALDIEHFDTTRLKLFDGNNTTNEIANPNCGYDVADRRVYCKIDSIAIDASYTMQFVVKVKDILDTNVFNTEANNTAYAKYRNPNGHSYVIRYATSTGEKVGGKSNSLNAGVFSEYPATGLHYISLDAINNLYDYMQDRNITTKIVNSPFKLKITHINTSYGYSDYLAWHYANGAERAMPVILSLEKDGTPQKPLTNPNNTIFHQGQRDIIAPNLLLTHAHMNDRIKLGYLDWGTILDSAPSTSPCVTNSATSVNLNGLPACFNSFSLVVDVFPVNRYPKIANCYGEGNETLPIGKDYPCNPLAYSTGGDVANGNIYPEAYNHSYGCYQCITQGYIYFRNDSTDSFAARPSYFELNATNPSYPDLLRAGLEYNLSITAMDGAVSPAVPGPTLDYIQSSHSIEHSETKYLKNSSISDASLHGDINLTSSEYNITDGISVDASGSNEVVGFTYSDVGKINIQLIDKHWAAVDSDDTPQDCTSKTITRSGRVIPIEASAYICGDMNATFIPEHLTVRNITLKDHRDGSFTYLSSDLNMSAHIGVIIEAKNANDEITQNFKTGTQYYENPVSVAMALTESPSPHPNNAVVVKHEIPTAIMLGFGGTDSNGSVDDNGTINIKTTETDASKKLMFNFTRDRTVAVNPFDYNGSDINITVKTNYSNRIAPEHEGNITLTANAVGTGKAHFIYGKVRASKDFYSDITANSINTDIMVQVYCDQWPATATQCPGIDLINGVTNDNHWWLSWNHNEALGDGNITLISPPTIESGGAGNNPTVTTDVSITSKGTDDTVVLNRGGNAVPMTVSVKVDTTNPTDTNTWLLPPTPTLYGGKFIGTSSWTGHGKTGHVVDSNASKKINRRLGW